MKDHRDVVQHRHQPDRTLPRLAQQDADRQQQRRGDRRRRQRHQHLATQGAIVAGHHEVHPDVDEAHDRVAGDEDQRSVEPTRLVVECLRDGKAGDEHRCRRDHEREPHHTGVAPRHVREPRVRAPGPPQQCEDDEPVEDRPRSGAVGHEPRDLCEREHVHEVEEQLERGDPVAFAGGAQAEQRTADRCGHRPSLRCGDLTWAPDSASCSGSRDSRRSRRSPALVFPHDRARCRDRLHP
jgi:hypothetical protein